MKVALYRMPGTTREYVASWVERDDGTHRGSFSHNRDNAALLTLMAGPDGGIMTVPPLPKTDEYLHLEPVTVVSLEKPDGK